MKLTKSVIENTAPDPKKRIALNDSEVKGFGVRITPNGQRSFFFRYRPGGRGSKEQRITIGRFGDLTVDEARRVARKFAGEVAQGRNPAREKKERAEQEALAERRKNELLIVNVAEVYIERHLIPNTKSWKNSARILNKEILPFVGNLALDTFNRQDMTKLLDRYQEKPATKLLVFRTMSAMINWSMTRGLIEYSTIRGMKAPKPVAARDRVLTDHEVAMLWEALENVGMGFEAMFKTLLLTAQRRGEVAGMAWEELDLTNAVWIIPSDRSKNKQPHDVDLSPYMVDLLKKQPRTGPYVFGGEKPNPPSGISKAKRRVDAEMIRLSQKYKGDENATIPDWRLHDLRRTAATGMARMGYAIEVVERVLNHISNTRSGIAAVYQRYDHREERRNALKSWSEAVLEISQCHSVSNF